MVTIAHDGYRSGSPVAGTGRPGPAAGGRAAQRRTTAGRGTGRRSRPVTAGHEQAPAGVTRRGHRRRRAAARGRQGAGFPAATGIRRRRARVAGPDPGPLGRTTRVLQGPRRTKGQAMSESLPADRSVSSTVEVAVDADTAF